ncbi:MAG: MerR family transcriptional regulator [Acetobacter sp.]|uniref:MerR family transcriptional regulator n=1 Tax=Acetobacter sp. TaxID=440 RepID=UPI0039E9B603
MSIEESPETAPDTQEADDEIRGRKGPLAFRTISEVADELKVPQHVLRFWETRFEQVRPLKRGGGRRYYRPEDVDLLRRIATLLYVKGYTIKGVQRVLREKGPEGLEEEVSGKAAEASVSDTVSAPEVSQPQDEVLPVTPVVQPEPQIVTVTVRDEQLESEHDRMRKSLEDILHRLAEVKASLTVD